MTTEFLLLGTVEARHAGKLLDIGPTQQRSVLVALLTDVNLVVSPDQLVDRVWGDRVPAKARTTLRSYLSRLRRALEGTGVEIAYQSRGYLLHADPVTIDLHRFVTLLDRARTSTDDESRASLTEALGLWRGEPFAGMDTPWLNGLRDSLEAQRFAAELDHVDLRLGHGEHGALVAELTDLAATHPLDERVAGQLMLALYRCGRPSEALDHYQRTRRRLDELGVAPTPALRELHQRILSADPAVSPPESTRSPVPRQLPAPPRPFTARADELRVLDKAAAMITAIGGPGGIGKTWLAVHWAHGNADRFPDGQLYVNLRGFDPSGAPTPSSVALRGFLDALGVPAKQIPVDVDAQAALYRSLTAGKRMLVVLDNAHDTDQVLPLLPGSATCVVLVTSRHKLTGLVTAHGARLLPLDVIDDATARELLASHLGHERLAAEPDAVADLVASCGGLPLAVGIVAARAAAHPSFSLRSLADDLRSSATRVAALDAGEPNTSLDVVFSSSHRALAAGVATMFELLSLSPGPDSGVPAAAALAGLPVAEVRATLRKLENAYLVEQPEPDRFRMHDLIRLHAATQARRNRPEADREAALDRLVDHYLHTAHRGERVLQPMRPAIELAPPTHDCQPEPLPDETAALAWFNREHANLLAVQQFAADHDRSRAAWQLAWALLTFHSRRGHMQERLTVWQVALDATQRLGDENAQALAHRYLGYACAEANRNDEALAHLEQALVLVEKAGDLPNQAAVHHSLARAWEQRGEYESAVTHAMNALRLYEATGNTDGTARMRTDLAWLLARLGRYDEATAHCETTLAMFRQSGNRDGQAATLDTMGYVANIVGRHAEALERYHQALALYEDVGDDYFSADTLDHLGQAYSALGKEREARRSWQRALRLYRAQHRAADVERVERLLTERHAKAAR